MSRIAIVISFERGERDGVPIEEIQVDSGDNVNPTTHEHHLPPGDDSVPLPGDYAALVDVEGAAGEEAIVAYSDPKNAGTALPGEKRLYARNTDGDIVVSIHLKNDGSAVVANENGSLTLEADGSVTVTGDLNVNGEVSAKAALPETAVKLSTHLHPSATGPTGSPTPGT